MLVVYVIEGRFSKYLKNVLPVINDRLDTFQGSLINYLWIFVPLKTKAF